MTEEFFPNLKIFGVSPVDPGHIYLIQHGNRFKIGKSKNITARMKAAKTWLPDMNIIGAKPFWSVSQIERQLHEGFARCWYEGEWFELIDEGYRETLLTNFVALSDTNRDMNSVNFIYWFNGDGLAEFVRERHAQGLTLSKFQQQESEITKDKRDK
jgi:hypothetical protein